MTYLSPSPGHRAGDRQVLSGPWSGRVTVFLKVFLTAQRPRATHSEDWEAKCVNLVAFFF